MTAYEMRISDWSSDVCSSDLLKLLDQLGRAGEQHAPTILDKLQPDGCRQVALSSARRAEQDELGALFQPSVARGHGRDLRPPDHRPGVEGAALLRFARWKSRVRHMTLPLSPATFAHFILAKCSQQPGGGAALPGGPVGP